MGLEANSAKIKDHGLAWVSGRVSTIGPWLEWSDFQWEGANSGPLSKFSQNQGPWFGVGQWEGGPWSEWSDFQWEGANSGPLSQLIQAKSRTMVWHQPLVLG